jgi:hypothetical protein
MIPKPFFPQLCCIGAEVRKKGVLFKSKVGQRRRKPTRRRALFTQSVEQGGTHKKVRKELKRRWTLLHPPYPLTYLELKKQGQEQEIKQKDRKEDGRKGPKLKHFYLWRSLVSQMPLMCLSL